MIGDDGKEVRRVLIIRGGGLGDFVLTLPVLKALRRRWPEADLELVANPEMADFARSNQLVLRYHSIGDASIAQLFSRPYRGRPGSPSLPPYLRGFDIVISFLRDQSGYLESNLRPFCRTLLFVEPAQNSGVHAAKQFLSSLRALGIDDSDLDAGLLPEPEFPALAQQILPSCFDKPASPVAVHPGSGSQRKNWKVWGYAEILLWIEAELGRDTLVITGEADRKTSEKIRTIMGDSFPRELCLPTLRQLAAVLSCCDLLIGNDSGVSHLAAALGTHVLALFGPTSPSVWRPIGPRTSVIRFEEATAERLQREISSILCDSKPEKGAPFPESRL